MERAPCDLATDRVFGEHGRALSPTSITSGKRSVNVSNHTTLHRSDDHIPYHLPRNTLTHLATRLWTVAKNRHTIGSRLDEQGSRWSGMLKRGKMQTGKMGEENVSFLSSKEKDNILRWDGKRRGCFELYFLKWNDEKSRTAGWIRYTMNSPYPTVGSPYCELWGIFFDVDNPSNNFAVKKRYPIDNFAWDRDRFGAYIDDASLSTNACNGAICDEERGHSLEWDLAFHSSSPT